MDYGLTSQQIEVIDALSAGATTLAAATQAGVHRNTIANWRRNNIAFQHSLAHAHYDRALAARESAEDLLQQAIQTVRDILQNPNVPASVRLRAALAILQTATTPPEPKKQVTLEIEKLKVLNVTEPVIVRAPAPAQVPAPASAPAPQPIPENLHNSAQPLRSERMSSEEIGRNQLCPCGSNLKYKRCCLNKPAPAQMAKAA